jgi:DNA-binding SARP family transcriptional activator
VLGDFELRVGPQAVSLPVNAQRVLGYLAVSGREANRERLAGVLWGESSRNRANANLRTALWRIRSRAPQVVTAGRDPIRLDDRVLTDLDESTAAAARLLSGSPVPAPSDVPTRLFEADLLPNWEDDWLLLSRERHHQLRLHALEALSEQLIDSGHYARAIDTGYAAISAEPLRDSARAAVIRAHLAEGNRSEAERHLALYRQILDDETGLPPSPHLEALVTRS